MVESTVEPSSEMVVGLTEETPIRVLHVDDEAGFLKVARQCLKMQGRFQVETALSVDEAAEKMKRQTFDVVISDYQMPEKDGLEFLKELRDSGNKVPFIMFTGRGREEAAMKALNLGADQYLNKTGDPETVYGELAHSIRQTVKRKRAEKMLRESEERFRNLYKSVPDALAVYVGRKGYLIEYNEAFNEWSGYSDEELKDKIFLDFVHPDDRALVLERYGTKYSEEELPLIYEIRGVNKRGEVIPTEISVGTYKKKGRVIGINVMHRDISDRKNAEKAIRESQEKFERLFMDNPEAAVYMDSGFHILDVNPHFAKVFDYSLAEVKGKHINDVVVPKDKMEEAEKFDTKASNGKTYHEDTVRKRKDGTLVPVSLSAAPIIVENKVAGHVAVYKDITQLKRSEKELEESKRHFQTLFNVIVDPVVIVDGKGKFLEITDRVEEITGFKREELLGKNFFRTKIVTARSKAVLVKNLAKRMMGMDIAPYEVEVVTKDGGKLPYEINAAKIEYKDKSADMVVFRDVSERKKIGEKLRESEERFRNLYESIQDPVGIFVGREGLLIDHNKAFKKLCGYTDEELKDKFFLDFIHPDDQAMVLEKYRTEYSEEELPLVYEIRGVNKKGEAIPLEISVSTYKKGDRVIGILVIHRDITKRKQAEKAVREMMVKLVTVNEKLRVVGRLTRHDIRNKLSAVTGNVYLAKQALTGDHEALKYLGEIEPALQQTERIFDFARAYEKLGVEELAYMDVEKSVGEAVSLFPDLRGAKVVNDCRGLTVLADSLLRQLFYNLIHNSLRHGEKVSQIKVYYEEAGKDKLKLVYEDDGVGIPKAEKEKIFKEGYGKGTGYGLYLIRKMCEVYNWTIHETGKSGKGAEFTITMPQMNENGKEIIVCLDVFR